MKKISGNVVTVSLSIAKCPEKSLELPTAKLFYWYYLMALVTSNQSTSFTDVTIS